MVVPELQKYTKHSSMIIKLYTNRAIKYLQETDGHIIKVNINILSEIVMSSSLMP